MKFYNLFLLLVILRMDLMEVKCPPAKFTPRIDSHSVLLLVQGNISFEFITSIYSELLKPDTNTVIKLELENFTEDHFIQFNRKNYQHFGTILVIYDKIGSVVSYVSFILGLSNEKLKPYCLTYNSNCNLFHFLCILNFKLYLFRSLSL